ncbi:MAG: hypothetical protein FGM32_08080 [Candidatus Kapabacteria bacterium]|nr:hypothetical protein [Candidatus Kapabacteria bacterium]
MLFRAAIIALIASSNLAAQSTSTETLALRLGGGFASTSHTGSISSAGGILDCGSLTSGSGMGPGGYAALELPITSWGALGLEVGLTNRNGAFSRTNTYPLRDTAAGKDVTMTTQYTLDATISNLDVSAQLQLPIIGTLQRRTLGLSIGPRLALPMTASFAQRESVVSPESAVFLENGIPVQERLIREGALQTRSSLLLAISAGVESFIPLSDRLSIVPRVSADYFLTDVVTDAAWKPFTIRADVALRLSLTKKPVFAPPPPPPVIVEAPSKPSYAPPMLVLEPRSFTGEIVTGNVLRASTPIVNAVFFDSARADIPASYRVRADGSAMSSEAVAAHDWILPRIAAIVASNPSARIVLEGATSGTGTEPEGLPLAKRRAEAVRGALVGLGVPNSSITIAPSVSPRIASNADLPGGRAENRRVDIVVQNAPLQRFILTEQYAELRGTATVASRFQGGPPEMRPSSQVISANKRDTSVGSLDAVVAIPVEIMLDNSARPPASISTTSSAGGQFAEKVLMIDAGSLARRSNALDISEFEAVIRFDYNSADLLDNDKTLLRQLTEQLPEGTTIVIEGSADVLGTLERNRQLSSNRAANTEAYIRSITAKSFTFATTSLASPYSDATPQGRFLNRNIRIRLK